MDDQVELPVARMRSEPAPEGVRSRASRSCVSIPDEDLDVRSRWERFRGKGSDWKRGEDAEYSRRRPDAPTHGFGGVIEDRAAAEGLPNSDDRNGGRADGSKGRGDTAAECGQGGARCL